MFSPERVSPILLSHIHKILTENGIDPLHIAVCYDGMEDDQTYSTTQHFHPLGHDTAHAWNLARALRGCIPESDDPNINGLFVRFFEDGTLIVAPAAIGSIDPDEEDDEDDDE